MYKAQPLSIESQGCGMIHWSLVLSLCLHYTIYLHEIQFVDNTKI